MPIYLAVPKDSVNALNDRLKAHGLSPYDLRNPHCDTSLLDKMTHAELILIGGYHVAHRQTPEEVTVGVSMLAEFDKRRQRDAELDSALKQIPPR